MPFSIVFIETTFNGPFEVNAKFEKNVRFINSDFKRGLYLNGSVFGGELMVSGGTATPDDPDVAPIQLTDTEIADDLAIWKIACSGIVGEGVKAKGISLSFEGQGPTEIAFPRLEATTVYAHGSTSIQTSVGDLNLEEAVIKNALVLKNVTFESVHLRGLKVQNRTALAPGVTINKILDVSTASLGILQWSVPLRSDAHTLTTSTLPYWPVDMRAYGLSFTELYVGASRDGATGDSLKSVPGSDLNDVFLTAATYSESAFSSYEQLLRSRGQITHADDVYKAMRRQRRIESWHTADGISKELVVGFANVLDVGQQFFLGYGRFVLPPIVWSITFVVLGTIIFGKDWMESQTSRGEQPPEYSAFWFSLELFLPVVELGIAKGWRAKPKSPARVVYARIHQLAGWVLIPVTLAALTGVVK